MKVALKSFRYHGIRLLVTLAFPSFLASSAYATDRYWSGGAANDNISESSNWFGGNPNPTDNLYFNNTGVGLRHTANSNYSSGSYFDQLVSYSGAGGIKFTGDKTFLLKFENFSDPSLLEATATLSNRTGPDNDLEINPVGSGGVKVANVDIQNGKDLKVYGNNQLIFGGAITQSGTGNATFSLINSATVRFDGANTYTGRTTVNGGTLLLGASDRIDNSSAMTLNSGKFSTGGFSETVGALTLSSSSIIDMGAAASTLHFGDSSGIGWVGTLSIWNWTSGSDHLFFGSNSAGLTSTQLNLIKFYSDSGVTVLPFAPGFSNFTGASGEVIPVPEPSAVAAAFGLLGLIYRREHRRMRVERP